MAETKALRVAFSLDMGAPQVEEAGALLERILPRRMATEMEWVGGLPISYTPLAYLKGDGNQYIKTGIYPDGNKGCCIETELSQHIDFPNLAGAFSNSSMYGFVPLLCYKKTIGFADKNANKYPQQDGSNAFSGSTAMRNGYQASGRIKVELNYTNSGMWGYEDEKNTVFRAVELAYFNLEIYLFARHYGIEEPGDYYFFGWDAPIYSARFSEGKGLIRNFIPALDPTGTPCMFDTVTRKPFYNYGIDDFTYPGKETEATTYSLRHRMYAQMTPHGIRRLYRVPAGYSSKEEYAAEHGFKVLIETPRPEVGYWSPVWHDREDCIELEWEEVSDLVISD